MNALPEYDPIREGTYLSLYLERESFVPNDKDTIPNTRINTRPRPEDQHSRQLSEPIRAPHS